jgi:hypothetical protein
MRKLKLWGWKLGKMRPENGRFVATIYAEDGKVVIHADTSRLVKDLHEAIDPGAYERGFRHAIVLHESGTFETARDSHFLDSLTEQNGLWWGHTYDGWTIDAVMSKIVDE